MTKSFKYLQYINNKKTIKAFFEWKKDKEGFGAGRWHLAEKSVDGWVGVEIERNGRK